MLLVLFCMVKAFCLRTSNKAIGGPLGIPYTFQDKNALLSILVVHRDDDYIRGLTMELSNGRTESVGYLVDNNPVVLNFQDCQITNIVVYSVS